LIGIPWRVTVSARSLKSGGVELKKRSEAEREVKPLDDFANWLAEQICSEQKRLVVTV
jgi:prolyl-tRNA synthetase